MHIVNSIIKDKNIKRQVEDNIIFYDLVMEFVQHHFYNLLLIFIGAGLPWWLSSKESPANAGDTGSIPGSGRCPGEGNGSPLQYSCLENSMD